MSFNDSVIFQDNVSMLIDEKQNSMTYWWNENDTEKPKNSKGNQFQCQSVRHISRKEWPKIVPGGSTLRGRR